MTDPVKGCDVYKNIGCSHVDGFLCDYPNCSILKNYKMTEDRKHIGYIEREEGYYKLYAPEKGSIVTRAFILCKYCNGAIYSCMGPRDDAVCFKCYEKEPELR
jgi:hypothetical protein